MSIDASLFMLSPKPQWCCPRFTDVAAIPRWDRRRTPAAGAALIFTEDYRRLHAHARLWAVGTTARTCASRIAAYHASPRPVSDGFYLISRFSQNCHIGHR